MKQTVIIHGSPDTEEFYDPASPSPSNHQWLPWLQRQLSLRDELCQTPEMPKPYDAIYKEWAAVFEQFELSPDSTLIGHSCGGGFLLRYLSEHPELKVAKVVLVAPWLDPGKTFTENFFDFTIDSSLADRTDLHIFSSSDDDENVIKSYAIIKAALPKATYHEYMNKGHFCFKEFPELLEIL